MKLRQYVGFICLVVVVLSDQSLFADEDIRVSCTFDVPTVSIHDMSRYDLTDSEWGDIVFHDVFIPGLIPSAQPGDPVLPWKHIQVLIPDGMAYENISVVPGITETLGEGFIVTPGQLEDPLTDVQLFTPPGSVYESDGTYPETVHTDPIIQQKRGYTIASFLLCPIQYEPKTGFIRYVTEMSITLYVVPEEVPESESLLRGLPVDAAEIAATVENADAVSTYPATSGLYGGGASELMFSAPVGEGPFEYVIITAQALLDVSGGVTPNLQTLLDHKMAKGLSGKIVTVEWIYENYSGLRPDGGEDNQTRIRNFITDAYQNWQTQYVLLAGDCDREKEGTMDNTIPIRMIYNEDDTSRPTASDIYYACLDGTMDGDADGIYGECNDGADGGLPDGYAEVLVGRAPVDSAEEIAHWVHKVISYENSNGLVHSKMLLCSTSGTIADGTRFQDDVLGVHSVIEPYDEMHCEILCEASGWDWPLQDVIDQINDGLHMVFYSGHGQWYEAMKFTFDNSAMDALSNTDYFFWYHGMSCLSGMVDNYDEMESDCITEAMVTHEHGPFAMIANTRIQWSMDCEIYFFEDIIQHRTTRIAEAFHFSRESGYTVQGSLCRLSRLVYFGDPETSLHLFTSDMSMSQSLYVDDDMLGVTVRDQDFNQNEDVQDICSVRMSSDSGDEEYITLMETSFNSGVFEGGILLKESTVSADNILNAAHGDVVYAEYYDPLRLDGTEGMRVCSANTDFSAPSLSDLEIHVDVLNGTCDISWTTDEDATCILYYWMEGGDLLSIELPVGMTHAVTITDLQPESAYFFRIEMTDINGNQSVDDNQGEDHQFVVNHQPVIHPMPAITVVAGDVISYQIFANDGDGSISMSENLLAAANGGEVVWYTGYDNEFYRPVYFEPREIDQYRPDRMIDGNRISTYWRSEYRGPNNHKESFVFKLSRPSIVHRLLITCGNSGIYGVMAPKDIEVSVSMDQNGPWELIATPGLADTDDPQPVILNTSSMVSFIKIRLLSFNYTYANNAVIKEVEAYSGYDETLSFFSSELPGDATLSSDGMLDWQPSTMDIGAHDVDICVSDGITTDQQSLRINVVAAGDSDLDTISDYDEVAVYGTNPMLNDSDGDGLSDDVELLHGTLGYDDDTDDDGLSDYEEVMTFLTDPGDEDSDNDGLEDGYEVLIGSSPFERDTDGDGLSDQSEVRHGTNPTLIDTDGDGLTDMEEGTPYINIDTQFGSGMALDAYFKPYVWGNNQYEQINDSGVSTIVNPVPYGDHVQVVDIETSANNCYVLKADGSVHVTGQDNNGCSTISEITDVIKIISQYGRVFVLRADGTVWGDNYPSSLPPEKVVGLEGIIDIADGAGCFALKNDGTVWGWEFSYYRGFATDEFFETAVPVRINGLSQISRIYSGGSHGAGVAIDENGGVWYWGGDQKKPVTMLEASGIKSVSLYLDDVFLLSNDGQIITYDKYLNRTVTDGDVLVLSQLENNWVSSNGKIYYKGVAFDGVNLLGPDPLDGDTDDDGLSDYDELKVYLTDPAQVDTDGDSMPDAWELANLLDPRDETDAVDDPDTDGIPNLIEYLVGLSAQDADSDGDDIPDGMEDYDGDGVNNMDEVNAGTSLTNVDSDDDLLDDYQEIFVYGADPLDAYTDADSLMDGEDVFYHADPTINDTDGDGVWDGDEVESGSLPDDPDTDDDGLTDGREGNPRVVLSGGYSHTVVSTGRGKPWVWGKDDSGALGNGEDGNAYAPIEFGTQEHALNVDAGYRHSVMITRQGDVWQSGAMKYLLNGYADGSSQEPVLMELNKPIIASASGTRSLAYLTAAGDVLAIGYNNGNDGVLVKHSFGNAIAISVGAQHYLALRSDGAVWGWGYNGYGQLGRGSRYYEIDYFCPGAVHNVSDIIQIAAGYYHNLALRSDGTVWGWGCNSDQQLAVSHAEYVTTPEMIPGLEGLVIVDIAAGSKHSMVLTEEGQVYAWGGNSSKQIGVGSSDSIIESPTLVSIPGNVIDIECGHYHSMALTDDGKLWMWGNNANGQLGLGFSGGVCSTPVPVPGFYMLNPAVDNPDTDGDGFDDKIEVESGLNPLDPDDVWQDRDGDGLPTGWEAVHGLNPDGCLQSPSLHWTFDDFVFLENEIRICEVSENNLYGILDQPSENGIVAGLAGRALQFSTDNSQVAYVDDCDLLDYSENEPFSVLCWYKSLASDDEIKYVVMKGDSDGANYGLFAHGDYIQFMTRHSNGKQRTPQVPECVVQPNRWYHLAGVYDGENIRLYINGVEVSSVESIYPYLFSNHDDLVIGYHMNGLVDDVRLYNRALTALDIASIYEVYSDEDADGLTAFAEYHCGTNPNENDSDNDGIADSEEDPDGDGVVNSGEMSMGSDPLNVETWFDRIQWVATFSDDVALKAFRDDESVLGDVYDESSSWDGRTFFFRKEGSLFADVISSAYADEFESYDVNNDGFVVGQDVNGDLIIYNSDVPLESKVIITDADGVALTINNHGTLAGASGDNACWSYNPEPGVERELRGQTHADFFGAPYINCSQIVDVNDAGVMLGCTVQDDWSQILPISYPPYIRTIWHEGKVYAWQRKVVPVDVDGTVKYLPVYYNLGHLGGWKTWPVAINEVGAVVGSSLTMSGDEHAFLWVNNTMSDLGAAGGDDSHAAGINNYGQIIGWSGNASQEMMACLYENETWCAVKDYLINNALSELTGKTIRDVCINHKGQLAVVTEDNQDQWQIYILTPLDSDGDGIGNAIEILYEETNPYIYDGGSETGFSAQHSGWGPDELEFSAVAVPAFTPEVLCHWTFDGLTSTYLDDVEGVNSYGWVNNVHAVITGEGVHKDSLRIDEDSGQYGYVLQNNLEIHLNGNQVSVACWYKREHDNAGSYSAIVAKGGWKPDYGLVEFGRRMCFQVKLDGVDYHTELNSEVETPFGEWCYVVGVYDGNSMSLFINGDLKSSVPAQGNITPDTGIGIFIDAVAAELDEVKLYDVALEQDDVTNLMEVGADDDGDGVRKM